uniref:Uncharacterized protein n=1 Tax=Chromera velia CCMP2878 TaxID=1169474 RepID=A0A0G4H4U0_9ALVE|eukprot:Cvel_5697.t1-p1 / transcript=Cvel_5697.t1 / gene=Cvel_5697 / organism=Chromera_velia_CCMP2878 / gene_product=hypothetical protein / transcript_product=hypothetical protein / location=Cvel_scaffold269:59628-62569(-) / protein_length=564 / sequence_SO=supercontig / SO=protein_coding / is_pseudo=false
MEKGTGRREKETQGGVVSSPRFGSLQFLREGVENYRRFLSLRPKAAQRGVTLVLTYQIDLFWHAHMLASLERYRDDCFRLMGMTLHHDDSLTDRSVGGILDTSFGSTEALWREAFGCGYAVEGGMYRGEPPPRFFHPQWVSSPEALKVKILLSPSTGEFADTGGVYGEGQRGSDTEELALVAASALAFPRPTSLFEKMFGTPLGNALPFLSSSNRQTSLPAPQLEHRNCSDTARPPPQQVMLLPTAVHGTAHTRAQWQAGEVESEPEPSLIGARDPWAPSQSQQSEDIISEVTPVTTPQITPDSFIPANSRSRTKGVNSNPAMSNYIFGNGPDGVGYYHMKTPAAFGIARGRAAIAKEVAERELRLWNQGACLRYGCCFCCLSSWTPTWNRRERELKKTSEEVSLAVDILDFRYTQGGSLEDSTASLPEGLQIRLAPLTRELDAKDRARRRTDDQTHPELELLPKGAACGAGLAEWAKGGGVQVNKVKRRSGGGGSGGRRACGGAACGVAACGAGAYGGGGFFGGGGIFDGGGGCGGGGGGGGCGGGGGGGGCGGGGGGGGCGG